MKTDEEIEALEKRVAELQAECLRWSERWKAHITGAFRAMEERAEAAEAKLREAEARAEKAERERDEARAALRLKMDETKPHDKGWCDACDAARAALGETP